VRLAVIDSGEPLQEGGGSRSLLQSLLVVVISGLARLPRRIVDRNYSLVPGAFSGSSSVTTAQSRTPIVLGESRSIGVSHG
jgi:hypothetical protein